MNNLIILFEPRSGSKYLSEYFFNGLGKTYINLGEYLNGRNGVIEGPFNENNRR